MTRRFMLLLAWLSTVPISASFAAGLGGSLASMRSQHRVAEKNHFTFVKNPAQLQRFVTSAILVPLDSTADFVLRDVSFPFARPEVKWFVERLAAEYVRANGAELVVTSLTRPLSKQPPNAHALSVHPTGMAVDFRVPPTDSARAWLERTLLALEAKGVLDVTREQHPAHYHVAVFPEKYAVLWATLPPLPPRPRPVARLAAVAAIPRVAQHQAPGTIEMPETAVAVLLAFGLLIMLGHSITARRQGEKARIGR